MTVVHVLVPVLDRPQNVVPLLRSLDDSDPGATVEITFIVSPGDLAEQKMLNKHQQAFLRAPFAPGRGDWARKINLGTQLIEADWYLLGADDLHFHPGWARAALDCAAATDALVVGTKDLCNTHAMRHRNFSTHPLVHHSYIERGVIDQPGWLLNENYDHNFPDRELAETAMLHGVWAYCDDSVVEHLHPMRGVAENDATYQKGLKNFHRDHVMFMRRRKLWRGRHVRYPRRVKL